jgi:parallel beta-helix repeat protein
VGNGISVEKTVGATIIGNQISTTSKAGVVTYPTAAQVIIADNQLDHIGTDNKGNGISVLVPATVVSNNRILTHSANGINLQSSNNVLIGNYIENGFEAGDGITLLTNSSGITLLTNSSGITLLTNSSGNLIVGNSIYNQAGSGIRLLRNNNNNVVIGNKCDTCSRYGISIAVNTCQNNVVIGNDLINNTIGPLLNSGNGTLIGLNNGYANENHGSSVQNGDNLAKSFTIVHGLPVTPTYYTAMNAASNLPAIDYVTADSTKLTVNYVTPPPLGIENVVIVWQANL